MNALRCFASGVAVLLLTACVQLPTADSLPESFDHRSVLVVIDDPRPQRRRNALLGSGYQSRRNYDVDPLLMKTARSIAEGYDAIIEYQWPIESIDAHCFVVLTDEPSKLIAQLNADDRVRYAQSINEFKSRGNLALDSGAAYKNSTGEIGAFAGRGQRIAIVDTFADIDHPDLPHDRVAQWDLVGPGRGLPKEQHGTAVLGLLAAKPMNGIGIDGAAPQASFGMFRGCWQLSGASPEATCDSVSLSLALQTAHEWNPDVVNLSLTGPRDRLLEDILSAMLAQGSFVVAAFDENRDKNDRFPLSRPGVVYAYGIGTESASMPDGGTVAIGARDALTLQPDAGYDVMSGHSMAAPIVSGRIAQFRESMPNAGIEALHDKLRELESLASQSMYEASERGN